MSSDRILDRLSGLFDHEIVGRAGRSTRLHGMSRAQQENHIWQVVNKTPEVMVKISGYGRGAQHALAHLNYVAEKKGREGVELETERGDIFVGKEDIETLAKSWRLPNDPPPQKEENAKRPQARETMHIVLSMPPGTDTEKMRRAVRAFSEETFPNNQYAFGEHTDEDHPHFHLTVKMRGRHGKKINTRKGDTVKWRERFAEKLRENGVPAVATPTAMRGVIRKPKNQSIWHIENRASKKQHKKNGTPHARSRVMLEKENAAIDEVLGKTPPAYKPWEAPIQHFQNKLRKEMLTAADQYQARATEGDHAKATLLRNFVAQMPPIETEHQALVRSGRIFAQSVKNRLQQMPEQPETRPSNTPRKK